MSFVSKNFDTWLNLISFNDRKAANGKVVRNYLSFLNTNAKIKLWGTEATKSRKFQRPFSRSLCCSNHMVCHYAGILYCNQILNRKSKRIIISTSNSNASQVPSGKPCKPRKYQTVMKLYVSDATIILDIMLAKCPESESWWISWFMLESENLTLLLVRSGSASCACSSFELSSDWNDSFLCIELAKSSPRLEPTTFSRFIWSSIGWTLRMSFWFGKSNFWF